jgi:hypothetical protein
VQIAKDHSKTIWGKAAMEKLAGRLLTQEGELAQLRKRVEANEVSIKQQSEIYWKEMEKKQNEPPPPPAPVDDEVLRNDYNTLYDFK